MITNTPVFELGTRVRATRGPSTIVGTVVGYSHHTQPMMSIHPDLIDHQFAAFDIWADDGWDITTLPAIP